jgi:type IV pilus assembly protein PilA
MNAFRRHRRDSAFTLIELMVAVAIIGILAATAITGFQIFQLRSKRSEALSNLASVRTAQLAFFNEAGGFVPAPPSPGLAGFPGPNKQNWQGASFSSLPGLGFDALGWAPEGGVFFDYDSNAVNGPNGWALTAAAYGDTDGDGTLSVFLYVVPDSAGAVLPASVTGHATVWDPGTCTPLTSTVAQVHWTPACGFPIADDF